MTFLPLVEFFILTHKEEDDTSNKEDHKEDNSHLVDDTAPEEQKEGHQLKDDDDPVPATTGLSHSQDGLAGAMTTLEQFFVRYRDVHNSLLRRVPHLLRTTFSPLLKRSHLIDLPNKRAYFQRELKRHRARYRNGGSLPLTVDRANIFEDTFNQFAGLDTDSLRPRLRITFQGEDGVDAGGITREWLQELAQQIFDPNYALFQTFNSVSYQPRAPSNIQNSDIDDNYLPYYYFVGRLVGKAMYDSETIDLHFTPSFYKHILGLPIRYTDIEGIDPELFQSLKSILETPNADDLYLNFTWTVNEFGQTTHIQLKPEGQNIDVTDANKEEYVQLIAEFKLTRNIRQQIDHFLKGFYEFIPRELISIFNERELELIISGLPRIDVNDWYRNTEYHGYRLSDPVIQWFWEIVRNEMDSEELAMLLQFCTGSAKLPVSGFAGLIGNAGPKKFSIKKVSGTDRFPVAHTCFNELDLPEYSSKNDLKWRLLTAIKETSGFFLV